MMCVNCGCHANVPDRGRIINRAAFLGSQIVTLRERVRELEKLSRKTPPKTLLKEWEKVRAAKEQLKVAQEQLATFVPEWERLKVAVGWR